MRINRLFKVITVSIAMVFLLLGCSLFKQEYSGITAAADLKEVLINDRMLFVEQVGGGFKSDYQKTEAIINWLAIHFDWKATDYKKRSVQEIIERGGGNCNDLAKVATNLMDSAQISYRKVREINVHPESERRQASASRLVLEKGAQMSVFGKHHNDHVWIEVLDQETGLWVPADPSLGVVGLDSWIEGRLAFKRKKTLDPGSDDMLLPFAIFARDAQGKLTVNRTEYYLIDQFDRYYGNRLSRMPQWASWIESVTSLDDKCLKAFRGELNLHEYASDITEVYDSYLELKAENTKSKE